MDLSKEYIAMCDCPEVQDGKMTKQDDVILCSCGRPWIADLHTKAEAKDRINHRRIWLPRQDQLQEIVDNYTTGDLLLQINKFYLHSDYTPSTSMEQLWLAFVMWELHQKKWDGKSWKKEKESI